MRVIAGKFKGRKLTELQGKQIRPTSDRIRESLFSILAQKIDNAMVLDLFAGTGALGIEALSRGAAKSFFIDKSIESVQIINKNIELLGIKESAEVLKHDVYTIISSKDFFKQKFDLIFLDPPYNRGFIPGIFEDIDLLTIMNDESILIIEHSLKENNLEKVSGLDLYDKRTYGKTLISFLRKKQISI